MTKRGMHRSTKCFCLDEVIATTPATILAEVAVKLRRLCDPELGMDNGDKDTDMPSLREILAVIEREIAPAPNG